MSPVLPQSLSLIPKWFIFIHCLSYKKKGHRLIIYDVYSKKNSSFYEKFLKEKVLQITFVILCTSTKTHPPK